MVNGVLRRPALWCALSAGLLVALCVPALWLHVSSPADTALAPQSIPALRAFADVRREFPGASEPAAVVATVPAGQAAALRTEAARLQGTGHALLKDHSRAKAVRIAPLRRRSG